MYSSRDFLCDLIANRRLTRRTTSPAGIVKNMKKTAAPPPVELSLTYIIGQNAIHAEITEIATMLRTMLGRSTELPVRVGEYALSRHHIPYQSRRIRHPVRNSIPIAFAISRAIFLESSSNVSTKLVMSNFHSPSSSECPWISYS